MIIQEAFDPRLLSLLALWHERRGARPVPDRMDFSPELLRPWLGSLVLIDVLEGGRYRYRLYGSNFVFRFGIDMTGRMLDSLPSAQAAAIAEDYDLVVRTAQPLSRRYTSGFDIIDINRRLDLQRVETWERLVLPLTWKSQGVAMLLIAAIMIDSHLEE